MNTSQPPAYSHCSLLYSDHRALYIDIDLAQYLNGNPSVLFNAAQRGIKTNDPRAVKIYHAEMTKFLQESDFENRLQEVETKAQETTTRKAALRALDTPDKQLTTAKLAAEKECLKVQSHPWSPKLREAQRAVRYWKLWLSEIRLGKDLSMQRNRAQYKDANRLGSPMKPEVQKQLRQCQATLRALIQEAALQRNSHLIARMKDATITGEAATTKAVVAA